MTVKRKIEKKLSSLLSSGQYLVGVAERIIPSEGSSYDSSHQKKLNKVRKRYGKWFYSCKALIQMVSLSVEEPIENFIAVGEKILEELYKTLTSKDKKTSRARKIFTKFQYQISLFKSIKEIYTEIEPLTIKTAVAKGLYDNELDQAQGLLKGGHFIPSAALGRAILENGLDLLLERENLQPKGEGIQNKGITLKKNGIITKTEYRSIQKWAEVGNIALHEKGEKIKPQDVSEMIQGVRSFIQRFELTI